MTEEIGRDASRVDRRRFLRRGAITAAVATAGAAALGGPAGAAEGANIVIGTGGDANNVGTTTTTLTGSTFRALNGNNGLSLVGEHTGANAIGIEGRSASGPQLRLAPNGVDVIGGSAITVAAGSLLADSTNQALWYFYAGGTTGPSGTAGAYALNGVPVFVTLSKPSRQYDSRAGFPQNPQVPPSNNVKGTLSGPAGQERVIWVANTNTTFVTAVLLTVTVVNTAQAGFLAVGPGDFVWNSSAPFSSTNWFTAGQVTATTVATSVDLSGQVKVRAGGPGVTDFVVDLVGLWLIP